jgi:hypothetical protein
MPSPVSASVGWSQKPDALGAGKEAAEMARAELPPSSPQLAFVFGSSWFAQAALLQGVHAVLGDTPVIGGSTAGEITPAGPLQRGVVVLLIGSESLRWQIGVGEDVRVDPRNAGQRAAYAAAQGLPQGTRRLGFLLFGDGLCTGYADVVRGIQEVLGTSSVAGSVITGALTADDLRFVRTHQYANRRVLSHAVVGALLTGEGQIGVGIEHGFAPISKPRRVTRAQANVLRELDGQRAASVYEEYFGQDLVGHLREGGFSRSRIAYPLGVQAEAGGGWLLRTITAFEEDGSLACSAEVPEGSWLQLMIGSPDLAIDAAHRAAQAAVRTLSHVAAVLVFDSVARRLLLGHSHTSTEIAAIRRVVGERVPLAGGYTYGEQAPMSVASLQGRTAVQTGSVLVVALGS